MSKNKHVWIKCPLCDGKRFFDMRNGIHYRCPLCRVDGCILVKDGKPVTAVVPGALVRRILGDLERE